MADIVTLTINPAVDIFVSVDKVEPERKLRCSSPKRDPGGGGINVARAAQRLGSDVLAIYPTGGALGNLLHRLLEREGIASLVTPSHVETRENFTAFEEATGEQYRFVLPGSRLHKAEWEACLDVLSSLKEKPAFVVVSGSLPPGMPDDFIAQVVHAARKLGAKPVVDTSGPALKAALEAGVTVVKPNLNELREAAGATLDTEASRIQACRALMKNGRAEIIALTLGADGALLVTDKLALRAAPMDIEVVSAVGAGDSFLGGLISALAHGKAIEEAFRVAMAAGAAAVMRPGTELCHATDVERLMPQVQIKAVEPAEA